MPTPQIMAVQPLSAVLEESQARTHCARCFESMDNQHSGGRGSRCSACSRICYCSRKCQKADWREHRPECKAWASNSSARTPTRTLRLAGRILNAINRSDNSNTGSMGTVNGGEDDGSSHAPSVREAVDELVHHNDDRSPEQKEEYMLMANFVARLCLAGCGDSKKGSALLWPSAQGRGLPGLVDAAYAVLGKLSCNVFSIAESALNGEVGCGLYLEAAAANHSCNPNAAQSFSGKTLSLRCTRPIRKGEEITIGITQIQKPGPARRESLRKTYFFECRCERCESPEGRAEDMRLEAFACPDSECSGFCLAPKKRGRALGESSKSFRQEKSASPSSCQSFNFPQEECNLEPSEEQEAAGLKLSSLHSPLSEVVAGLETEREGSARLTCDACGASSRPVEEARAELADIQELLNRVKGFGNEGQALPARRCLEQALGKAASSLHRANWMLSEIYGLLASVCVELQDFDAAATYASDGMDASRACLSGLMPYFEPWGCNSAITGKLLLYVRRQPEKAMPLLLEAEASIKVTHGDQHSLYREVRGMLDQAKAESGQSTGY
ncbi:conserved unknown protein [Ectocarpus siliculosus]|uniref:Uncharacterized protein n=1 Tax=Ectocarpus siliculosus TaxID=2880 RepID=D8LFM9_ECTSI|nr:conserved unknown protein [Ectocarpus siliculosus]|eukprot:CBN79949.1 conserved unknown protein [Ectocarpus siliculosus]